MPTRTWTSRRRAVAAPSPTGLRLLPDDSLGSLVVATVIAELRWTPDVAPLVVDRLARDAVAYPEQLGPSQPGPASRHRVVPDDPPRSPPRPPAAHRRAGVARRDRRRSSSRVAVGRSPLTPSALGIRLEPFVDGLESPVHVTTAGDGSAELYVVEQGGRIRVVGRVRGAPSRAVPGHRPTGSSPGASAGCWAWPSIPTFPDDPRIFVNYTRREDGGTIVSEFQVADGLADPRSQRILLSHPAAVPEPQRRDGRVRRGRLPPRRDGRRGRRRRPVRQWTGPPVVPRQAPSHRHRCGRARTRSRPTTASLDDPAYLPEIHASGLRNPWRFSVDPEGGHIYIADVGQNAIEEVSVLAGGAGGVSLGWNRFEGHECFSEPCDPDAHLAPAVTYTHDEGCTIVGGDVYRGIAAAGARGPLPVRRPLLGDDLGGGCRCDARGQRVADAGRGHGRDARRVRPGRRPVSRSRSTTAGGSCGSSPRTARRRQPGRRDRSSRPRVPTRPRSMPSPQKPSPRRAPRPRRSRRSTRPGSCSARSSSSTVSPSRSA